MNRCKAVSLAHPQTPDLGWRGMPKHTSGATTEPKERRVRVVGDISSEHDSDRAAMAKVPNW